MESSTGLQKGGLGGLVMEANNKKNSAILAGPKLANNKWLSVIIIYQKRRLPAKVVFRPIDTKKGATKTMLYIYIDGYPYKLGVFDKFHSALGSQFWSKARDLKCYAALVKKFNHFHVCL